MNKFLTIALLSSAASLMGASSFGQTTDEGRHIQSLLDADKNKIELKLEACLKQSNITLDADKLFDFEGNIQFYPIKGLKVLILFNEHYALNYTSNNKSYYVIMELVQLTTGVGEATYKYFIKGTPNIDTGWEKMVLSPFFGKSCSGILKDK